MKILEKSQEELLKSAIKETEGWRGALVGNPDPESLAEFDALIVKMHQALDIVIVQQEVLRKIRREARKHNSETVYCYTDHENGGCVDIGKIQFP